MDMDPEVESVKGTSDAEKFSSGLERHSESSDSFRKATNQSREIRLNGAFRKAELQVLFQFFAT